MLPKITIYKSALNDNKEIVLQTTTSELTLSKAIFACKELHGQHIIAFVNNVQIAGDDWYSYRLEMNDDIRIMSEPGIPIAGAFIGAAIAAYGVGALTAGTYIFHAVVIAAMLKGAAIGYALGSTLDALINPPTMPILPTLGDDKTDPSYGWTGPQMVTQPEGPVSVTYGQFLIGGTLIMQSIAQTSWYETSSIVISDLSPNNHAAVSKGRNEKLAITGWTYRLPGNILTAITEDAYVGDYCFKVTGIDSNGGIKLSDPFTTVTGRRYKITATVKTTNTDRVKIILTCGDDINTVRSGLRTTSNQWTQIIWFVTETHGGANARIAIYFPDGTDDGYAYFDNIIIGEAPSSEGNNYLNMLINLGEGPIEGVMKADETGVCTSKNDIPYILINGQPLENFHDVSWDYRLGTWNQSVIDHFHETTTYYSENRQIIKGTPVTYTGTGAGIEAFEVQLTAPGLFKIDYAGNIQENSITYQLEYRIVGAGAWTDGGKHIITGKSKTQVFACIKKSNLTPGQYEVKLTRTAPEYTGLKESGDLYLQGIVEIVYENIAYRNSALLALQIKANSQLSGATPNVTAMIRGKTVLAPDLQIGGITQTYDDCYWHDGDSTYKLISDDTVCTDTGNFVQQWTCNPIWNAKDFIINKRYGLGEYTESADWDNAAAVIEARYCWEMVTDFDSGTEHRFEMDLPISRFTAAPSAIKLLSRCFRGNIIWSNGKYKPVIDRARTPVQLFNESNIDPSSLKTTYLKASQIPNFAEVQYADPERNYNVNAVEIVDEDEWTSVKPLRRETISARGTVRASECLRAGRYYLNCGQHVTKIHEFDSDLDAIHCEPGDVVQVQNDLLAWGVGGRIISATSSSVTTNIDITYTAAYKIRVRLSDGTLETKTVASVSNNNRTINISGTFTSIPLIDSVFAYGATDVDSKPFKVKTMILKDHNKCSLVLAEESANKYTDTTGVSLPDPKYTTLPNPTDPPDNVTDLSLSEMSNRPGFYISFNIPQEALSFSYADVFLSMDNSNWWTYRTGVTTNSDIEVLGTKPGQIYYVKIVAYNRLGMANLSPVVASITITDINFIPPDINGLRLDGESTLNTTIFTKKDAKFVWRKGSLTSGAGHLPAGQENLGAGEWYDDVYYKYWVEIYVGGTQVRKEIIADNAYVYTFEKNLADNNGTASNSFTIKVWGYNEPANKKSKNPNTLAVTNPAPAAPSGLVANSWWEAIKFTWDRNTEIDFSYYYYRVKVETDSWSSWVSTTDNNVFRSLTSAEQAAHSSNATIYIEIKAYDTFGSGSSANSVNGSTSGLDIEATDINDFAITSSKIFTKIPILESDSWTNNSPSAGYVVWNEHKLYYNGALYTIAAGNTNNKYIYWNGSSSAYSNSASNPTLTDGQFIIATNISGIHDLAWNAIANQVIGSAYIQTLAVQTVHIQDLAVNNAKINDLDAGKINAGYLSANRIEAGTITLTKITGLGGLATGDDLDNVPNGTSYGRVALTSITAGKIIVAGLNSGVTARMFLDSTTKNNIEAWRHANDVTLIDGGDIYASSITANQIAANAITAAKINVTNLAAINVDLGTCTAGIVRSSDSKIALDLNNKYLKVYDASSVLRVHLGYIA